jgi:hypothetical protein
MEQTGNGATDANVVSTFLELLFDTISRQHMAALVRGPSDDEVTTPA